MTVRSFTQLSIERKLPLLISALLTAAIAASVAMAYQEVRHSALLVTTERLQAVTKQLADLLSGAVRQRLTDVQRLGEDRALVDYLRRPGSQTGSRARARLARAVSETPLTAAVELWDTSGRRVLSAGMAPPPIAGRATQDLVGTVAERGAAAVGPVGLVADTLLYPVIAPVTDGGRKLGYVVQRRRVAANPKAAQQLAALIGSDAALFLGNAAGDLWIDFAAPVAPPPVDVTSAQGVQQYVRPGHGAQLALAVPLAPAPWVLLVEFPRERVLARPRAFLRRAAVLALALVVAGMGAAWAVSRGITRPLRQVTDAASAIAAGEDAHRLELGREDELGRLGEAFNTMAQRVGEARHDLERDVARRTAELREANAELESFSYSVSHDLRAPLRAIDGFAGMLAEDHGAALDADARRMLGVIQANTARMGQLIDDLLTFSRLGRKTMEATPLDLAALVHSVVDELRKAEGARQVDVIVGPLPPARGDRALLRQALLNLIRNALKFTRDRDGARVEIGAQAGPDGQVVYYVRDNGAGFDMRYAGKLFGVFQRLHPADEFEGTGVGLALVQRIVHRHGGRVWAEAKVNEGATFYFTLPERA